MKYVVVNVETRKVFGTVAGEPVRYSTYQTAVLAAQLCQAVYNHPHTVIQADGALAQSLQVSLAAQ